MKVMSIASGVMLWFLGNVIELQRRQLQRASEKAVGENAFAQPRIVRINRRLNRQIVRFQMEEKRYERLRGRIRRDERK